MQVVHFESIRVVELVDGLRFRLFALYNHDIREYELVSKFTVTKAVSAMVSNLKYAPHLLGDTRIKTRADSRRTGTSHCEFWP